MRISRIFFLIWSATATHPFEEKLMSMGAYACIEKEALMDHVIAVAKELRNVAEAQVRDPLTGS